MWNGTEDKIKVKITWIRHGMTQANGEHRYLGKTDEPLSETGIRLLQEKKKEYFSSSPEFLYTSPMKRCVQTAELLFERNPGRSRSAWRYDHGGVKQSYRWGIF